MTAHLVWGRAAPEPHKVSHAPKFLDNEVRHNRLRAWPSTTLDYLSNTNPIG